MGDPATDIAVLDVAAAAVVDGQAATHAVDLDVARTVAADMHIATDVGQVDATGADHADFNAALHALELDIARTDGIQPGIAAHIADLQVAGADRTGAGVTADVAHVDVAGAQRQQVQRTTAIDVEVARAHCRMDVAAGAAGHRITGADIHAERLCVLHAGVAGADLELQRQVVRHAAADIQPGVAVAEADAAVAALAAQAHHQLVAHLALVQHQLIKPLLAGGTGTTVKLAAALAGDDLQVMLVDFEHHRPGTAHIQLQRARGSELAVRGIGGECRQRQQQQRGTGEQGTHGWCLQVDGIRSRRRACAGGWRGR
ncbi:hypothetical protein G6F68_011339 [Rhizopus microsporus]|nr:hypothetical protein G6F68_011339 [Rhizopus microsporus]